MQDLRVGIIGCGFMGRTHSNAYRRLNNFFSVQHQPVLQAACGRDRERTEAFARTWGYARAETDWRRLIEAKDIDLIDICAPNVAHKEIAIAAAQAGKMVVCEKPLAMNVAEAEAMVSAVKAAGVANMVFFNYRRVPAVSLAKQLIDEGRIGRAFHYRAVYLQDWTISADVPQGGAALWRLDVADAGSGVTGDLLAHSIDTAMWLNGPVRRVVAKTETFVKERVHVATGRVQPVGIDDACMFLVEFANGSLGTFESTRYARGRKNFNTFELNGADGSLYFDLEEPEYLQYFEYRDPQSGKKVELHVTGWRKIHVTNSEHPYMSHYWVPGTCIGYEHTFLNAVADFVAGLESGCRRSRTLPAPSRRSGCATQCWKARPADAGWRSRLPENKKMRRPLGGRRREARRQGGGAPRLYLILRRQPQRFRHLRLDRLHRLDGDLLRKLAHRLGLGSEHVDLLASELAVQRDIVGSRLRSERRLGEVEVRIRRGAQRVERLDADFGGAVFRRRIGGLERMSRLVCCALDLHIAGAALVDAGLDQGTHALLERAERGRWRRVHLRRRNERGDGGRGERLGR